MSIQDKISQWQHKILLREHEFLTEGQLAQRTSMSKYAVGRWCVAHGVKAKVLPYFQHLIVPVKRLNPGPEKKIIERPPARYDNKSRVGGRL
jgi:hypothetical protein